MLFTNPCFPGVSSQELPTDAKGMGAAFQLNIIYCTFYIYFEIDRTLAISEIKPCTRNWSQLKSFGFNKNK